MVPRTKIYAQTTDSITGSVVQTTGFRQHMNASVRVNMSVSVMHEINAMDGMYVCVGWDKCMRWMGYMHAMNV